VYSRFRSPSQGFTVVACVAFKGSLEQTTPRSGSKLLKLQCKLQDATRSQNVVLFNDSAQALADDFPRGRVIEATEMAFSRGVLVSTQRSVLISASLDVDACFLKQLTVLTGSLDVHPSSLQARVIASNQSSHLKDSEIRLPLHQIRCSCKGNPLLAW
jgi:hypothetical protein